MDPYEKLILQNKAWASEQVEKDPEYFHRLAEGQKPRFLWIGCSDSRVPANEITETHPGDVFVHRNIANLVVHTDLNLLAVLQYAVEALKIEHIIVCGHYGCGGIKAALSHANLGLMNKWLRNIKDVYRMHFAEFESLKTEDEKVNHLVEINVQEQVTNLAKTSIVQKAWKNNHPLVLHGWVYNMDDGLIKEVDEMKPGSHHELDDIYRFEFTALDEE